MFVKNFLIFLFSRTWSSKQLKPSILATNTAVALKTFDAHSLATSGAVSALLSSGWARSTLLPLSMKRLHCEEQ